ncbi:MAG: transcriptional repressor [bacterium]|jgi:Fur family peroxide stress response transcriptional regulator|nr:transcriptional repressor [bacterium]
MKRNSSIRREKIAEALGRTRSHPTAEWIYDQVKQEIPDLSLGTVYRNLKILVEEGRARVIHAEDGKDHFDAHVEAHHHLICKQCGKVVDYYTSEETGLAQRIETDTGFLIDSDGLKLSGFCKDCKPKA